MKMKKICIEIGKLLDGKPDPCYTCANSDTRICLACADYDCYKINLLTQEVSKNG